jgi:Xaa-Pro aminopeptidase
VREQARIVNSLLKLRFERLLPEVMRETDFDMWLLLCNEDNPDPVFNTMVPFDTWTPILQIVVLARNADGAVDRLNLSRTNMRGLYENGWDPNGKDDQWACLKRVVKERNPKRIGVNESEVMWAADGLTATLRRKLEATLGARHASRLQSAEPLCIRWLETLIDEELVVYERAVSLGHYLIRDTFSSHAITPGVTTCEDLRYHYWQRAVDLGLRPSFLPFFNLVRSDSMKKQYDPADGVIRQGDLIHCDTGVEYLRLITDHQENAYILRTGEADAPEGLRAALREANRLQDIFAAEFQQGLTGNQILRNALTKARAAGIPNPKIYSHSLGHLLHEPGPLIGLPWEQENTGPRGDVVLDHNTCFTMELSVRCPVPEWGGQEVTMACEQDIAFTRDGVRFLDGRQPELHLVG